MKRPFPEIPGYHIERPIGEGGMAHVYLATQLSLDRQVAIKVVRFAGPDSEALSLRFENEARTIAQLEHPAIVGVFDVGRTAEDLPYYTMAYLPNGDLSKADIRGDNERIAEILETIARALGFAHAHGVVHRDVKPENVLFDREHRARLADFGISRSMHHNVRMTEEGFAPGSAAYMSPEQSRGGPIDARSDLYSLGVVAYEMLSGNTPFHATDPVSMALAHHQQLVPRLPVYQAQWQPLIDKALAKLPEHRFQNADEFIAALTALRQKLATTRIDPALVLPATRSSARPWLVWALLLVSMVAVGGMLVRQYSAQPDVESSVAAAHASSLEAARLEPLLADLPALIDARHWFEPEARSASSVLATALATKRSEQHLALADDFVGAVGAVVVEAITAARDEPALMLLQRLRAFAQAQAIGERDAMVRIERDVLQAVERRLDSAERTNTADSVAGLESLLMLDQTLAARWQILISRPAAGRKMQDAGGPPLRTIAVGAGFIAMAQNEVTRAEYEIFRAAVPAEAAKCRALGSFALVQKRRAWNDPGFDQQARHPVVCVSVDDARAYARWLSRRTGQRYRLPVIEEWRAAAAQVDVRQSVCGIGNVFDRSDDPKLGLRDRFDCTDGAQQTQNVASHAASAGGIYDLVGNVAEWVAGCTPAREDCTNMRVIGSSWRSGREQPLLDLRSAADVEPAALDVGFRVVREL